MFSSTSCVMVPKATFSPWYMEWHSSSTVNPLWMAWAPASPPLSKPIPESSVFASMTFSTASVQAPASRAILAFTPSSIKVSKHNFARAIAALVDLPFTHVCASLAAQARASKYVAKASPMPATVSRTGDFVMTSVSINTMSGFLGKNRYSSKTPSSV